MFKYMNDCLHHPHAEKKPVCQACHAQQDARYGPICLDKKYLCTPSTTPERKGYSDLEKEEITKPKAALVRIILSKIKVTCGHDIIDAKVLHRIFSQMRTRVTRNLEGDL